MESIYTIILYIYIYVYSKKHILKYYIYNKYQSYYSQILQHIAQHSVRRIPWPQMKPNGHGVVLYDPEVLVKSAFVR